MTEAKFYAEHQLKEIDERRKYLNRQKKGFHLAVAWKVTEADGKVDPRETEILHRFLEEYAIGRRELKICFKTSLPPG